MNNIITKFIMVLSLICLIIVPSSPAIINNNLTLLKYNFDDSYEYYNYQNMTDLFIDLAANIQI